MTKEELYPLVRSEIFPHSFCFQRLWKLPSFLALPPNSPKPIVEKSPALTGDGIGIISVYATINRHLASRGL
jgi:hypothetical protein